MPEDKITNVICLLSWRYGTGKDPDHEIVMAGLPVKQTLPTLPAIGDVLNFTPVLTALYGQGAETSQPSVSAKVLSVDKGLSSRIDYSMVLEVVYEKKIVEEVPSAVSTV